MVNSSFFWISKGGVVNSRATFLFANITVVFFFINFFFNPSLTMANYYADKPVMFTIIGAADAKPVRLYWLNQLDGINGVSDRLHFSSRIPTSELCNGGTDDNTQDMISSHFAQSFSTNGLNSLFRLKPLDGYAARISTGDEVYEFGLHKGALASENELVSFSATKTSPVYATAQYVVDEVEEIVDIVEIEAYFDAKRVHQRSALLQMCIANHISSTLESDDVVRRELEGQHIGVFAGAAAAAGRAASMAGRVAKAGARVARTAAKAAGRATKGAAKATWKGAKKFGTSVKSQASRIRSGASSFRRAAGKQFSNLRSKAGTQFSNLRGKAGDLYKSARGKASDLYKSAKGKYQSTKNYGQKLKEAGRSRLNQFKESKFYKGASEKLKAGRQRLGNVRDKAREKFGGLRDRIQTQRQKLSDKLKSQQGGGAGAAGVGAGGGGGLGLGGGGGGGVPVGGGGGPIFDDEDEKVAVSDLAGNARVLGGGGGGDIGPLAEQVLSPEEQAEIMDARDVAAKIPVAPVPMDLGGRTALQEAVRGGLISQNEANLMKGGLSRGSIRTVDPRVVSMIVENSESLRAATQYTPEEWSAQRALYIQERRPFLSPEQLTEYIKTGTAPPSANLPMFPTPETVEDAAVTPASAAAATTLQSAATAGADSPFSVINKMQETNEKNSELLRLLVAKQNNLQLPSAVDDTADADDAGDADDDGTTADADAADTDDTDTTDADKTDADKTDAVSQKKAEELFSAATQSVTDQLDIGAQQCCAHPDEWMMETLCDVIEAHCDDDDGDNSDEPANAPLDPLDPVSAALAEYDTFVGECVELVSDSSVSDVPLSAVLVATEIHDARTNLRQPEETGLYGALLEASQLWLPSRAAAFEKSQLANNILRAQDAGVFVEDAIDPNDPKSLHKFAHHFAKQLIEACVQ